MQKITPFLWCNGNAEKAVQFYTSVFSDANISNIVRYGKGRLGPEGALMTAQFELHGQRIIALNGGPKFQFTEAVSFVINRQDQEEVDYFWQKLSDRGHTSRCG